MTFQDILQPLSDFDGLEVRKYANVCYYYEGYCLDTGQLLRLPRTPLVEAIAFRLMQFLATDEVYRREGKMYGVLLVELPGGNQGVLKAFSGLLNGCSEVRGWVPAIPGRDRISLAEALTLSQLSSLNQALVQLQQVPEQQQYETLKNEFAERLQVMSLTHQQRQQKRQEQRQILEKILAGKELETALEALNEESRQDGIEKRKFKRQRDQILQPLQQVLETAEKRRRELKQQRRVLSRQLQAEMNQAYYLTNFAGQSLSLHQLSLNALPTGTGDCCAPKLLHYAATQGLKPLAMAEFWWGSSDQGKISGQFYEACSERCQPIMGFLLSGLSPIEAPLAVSQLSIIYEDEWLIAVNKPAGLLSVPGRYQQTQDSVLSRLRYQFKDGINIMAVHRLDEDTSGILLFSRDRQTHRQLSQQFQQRQVHKVYEALLSGQLTRTEGTLNLPLWGDPNNRPYQQVHWEHGKPSITHFQVIAQENPYTRVEFIPLTGRTHQIRVHAANARGLGMPIVGDRLYGDNPLKDRLYLHARDLSFEHPQLNQTIHLHLPTPF